MASHIKKGESLLIPFRNGQSISDSQLKPRMYKTMQAFEKSFPGHCLGTDGVELVEYAPVVRCKDCQSFEKKWSWDNLNTGKEECCGYCWHWDYEPGMSPNQVDGDDFCSCGERKTDG